ncbi:BMP family protein [Pararobbsia alpina]|uniref:Membrane lipoprotein TmpC n=1 Tax=Pararobbsia alpina TaxID=621374 RepID=A0A6S7B822_9BURK|nr:BMP family protein [Pararobbsia alpina]CAB3791176.1 Membrane lipoprotein TmpC [Pararobbsia alpina]
MLELPAGQAWAANGKTLKVALLMTGSVKDGGWNQGAFEGLERLKQAGHKTAYAENIPQAQISEVTRGYGDDGYDLIIGHGFEFGSAFLEIAGDYPNVKFFASTFKPQPQCPANTMFVDMAYRDIAYAAGTLAALISSKQKAVGIVGGGDNPTQRSMIDAFKQGAQAAVPAINPLSIITGNYNDAAKGREAASIMAGNGADVIWHIADVTGLGAIQGAVAHGAKTIGCYADQSGQAPKSMATSTVLDNGVLVEKVTAMVQGGKFMGGQEWKPTVNVLWHLSCGTQMFNAQLVPTSAAQAFQGTWNKLIAGQIKYAPQKA